MLKINQWNYEEFVKRSLASVVGVVFLGMPLALQAAPVDLSSWSAEGGGNWVVAGDNNSVVQTSNGPPTVFINGENSQGKSLSGTIEVQTTGDDDFIGFVLGFDAGDFGNGTADFILIDWKQFDQSFYGGVAEEGLAISRVTGVLGDNSGAWWHDPTNNVTELQRATNLGSTGWNDNQEYQFDLTFTSTLIEVFVNGTKELSINGAFEDGSFGFYNYSQGSVRYAGLEEDILPPAVPVPMALPLLASGLGAVGLMRLARRRR